MSNSPSQSSIENEDYAAGWTALFEMLYGGGSLSGRERNCVFVNTGEMPFIDISSVAGFDFADDGRALAKVDWDRDGRLDVWTMNRTAPRTRFLRNVSEDENNFIAFKLTGTTCNRDAIGARVKLKLANGIQLIETLNSGSGYLSQSTKWIHFGIGKETEIESVIVDWPQKDEATEEFSGLAINAHYELVQSTGSPVVVKTSTNRQVELKPFEIKTLPLTDSSRIILAGRVPVFPFDYQNTEGQTAQFVAASKPTLVNFWASWCLPCVEEISSFAQSDELNHQIDIVLLSGDKPEDRDAALAVLAKTKWQGMSGFASASVLDYFETLQNSLLSHKQSLPIPTSFLIDQDSNLVAIYKGTVNPEQLLADVVLCQAAEEKIWQTAIPFAGRWFEKPDVAAYSQMAIATNFTKQGNASFAARYLSAITDRIDPEPMAEEAEARMTLAGAQLNLANEFYQQGNVQQAVDLVREAIRFAPKFAKAHFNLGVIQQKQGNVSAAIESFENALNTDPNHAFSNFNLATIYEATKPDLAANFYSRAIETNGEFTQARYNLGLMLIKSGSFEAAERQFEAILSYETNADAHYQLGNIAIKTQDPATAIRQFNTAIEINAEHTDAMTNLAAILFSQQQFDKALDFLGKVASIKQNEAMAQFNFGIALLQSGRHDDAIGQFRKTLKINEQHPTGLLRLAQALVMKPDASKQELSEAIDKAQQSSQIQPTTEAAATTIIQQAQSRMSN